MYEEDAEYGLGIFKRVEGKEEFEAMDHSGYLVWRDTHTDSFVIGIYSQSINSSISMTS